MTLSLPDGQTLLRLARNKISRQSALAFASGLIAGLLTHGYMLLNKLPNHDDILALSADNDMTFLGRWFLFVPSAVSSDLSVPWVNGMLALLCLALCGALVAGLLQVKRPVCAALIGIVVVTFPVVGYTMSYMFTADAYCFALLLCVLGVYLADRYRWGFLAGGVLIGLSLACYQAYVFSAVALIGARGILLVIDKKRENRDVLNRALRFVLLLALAAAVYKAGLEISLRVRNMTLSSYMGLDQLQSFSLRQTLDNVPAAYRAFFAFMKEQSEPFSGRYQRLAFTASAGVCALLPLLTLVRQREKRLLRWALLLLLVAGTPLLFYGIYLASPGRIHSLMQYSLCFPFLLMITLYDGTACRELDPERQNANCLRQGVLLAGYAMTLSLALLCLQWSSRTNQMYLALELKFDNMLSMATRIVDRVEQQPEYVAEETPVWITGQLNEGNYKAVKSEAFAKASHTDATGKEWNYTFFFHNLYFRSFVNHYVGVTLVAPDDAAVKRALASPAFQEMPYFPYEGSVRCIDGIIVINAGPDPQELQ